MSNGINPKFQHQKVKKHTTSKLLNPIIFAIQLQWAARDSSPLQQDCKKKIQEYLFNKTRFPFRAYLLWFPSFFFFCFSLSPMLTPYRTHSSLPDQTQKPFLKPIFSFQNRRFKGGDQASIWVRLKLHGLGFHLGFVLGQGFCGSCIAVTSLSQVHH